MRNYSKPLGSCSVCEAPTVPCNRSGICPKCRHARKERARRAKLRSQGLSAKRTVLIPKEPCYRCGKMVRKSSTADVPRCKPCGMKDWRDANREHLRERNRQSYERNQAARLAHIKDYRLAHPVQVRERIRRYQAFRRYSATTVRVDPFAIYERDRGICQLCKKPVAQAKMSLDHIIPLSRGGGHTPDNLQLTHLTCNLRKNATGRLPSQIRLAL